MDQESRCNLVRRHTCVCLGPANTVLDVDPYSYPPPKKWAQQPQFSAHIYYGQTAGWIKMKLGMEVGLRHIVFDGDPATSPPKGHPQFSTHVCCGQTPGWIKMPLGREVGLGPGHVVLDADPAPLLQTGTTPNFRSMSIYCGQTKTVAHLSYC